MGRSILSVLAGYVSMSILTIATLTALGFAVPEALHEDEARIDPPWDKVMLASGFLWALVGGWIAARLASRAALGHAVGLAAFCLILWLPTMASAPVEQSTGYQVTILFSMLAGVLGGGALGAVQAARRAATEE